MDNIHSANGNVESGDKHIAVAAADTEGPKPSSDSRCLSSPVVTIETSKETTVTEESVNTLSPSAQTQSPAAPERPEDQNNNNQRGSSPVHNSEVHTPRTPSPPAPPSLPKVNINMEHRH